MVYAEPTAVAGLSGKITGEASLTATATATMPAESNIAATSSVSASLTGVFDYITDDNNFWLLAG